MASISNLVAADNACRTVETLWSTLDPASLSSGSRLVGGSPAVSKNLIPASKAILRWPSRTSFSSGRID